MFLKISQISRKTPVPESLFQYCNVIKKEALAQVFSCEFCETFQSTYFEENLQTNYCFCTYSPPIAFDGTTDTQIQDINY